MDKSHETPFPLFFLPPPFNSSLFISPSLILFFHSPPLRSPSFISPPFHTFFHSPTFSHPNIFFLPPLSLSFQICSPILPSYCFLPFLTSFLHNASSPFSRPSFLLFPTFFPAPFSHPCYCFLPFQKHCKQRF